MHEIAKKNSLYIVSGETFVFQRKVTSPSGGAENTRQQELLPLLDYDTVNIRLAARRKDRQARQDANAKTKNVKKLDFFCFFCRISFVLGSLLCFERCTEGKTTPDRCGTAITGL